MMFSVIVMKLNLTTGIIPSLNVAAGLLGFFIKMWTMLLEKSGLLKQLFTRQENTVIQTCVVACSDIAFSEERFAAIRSFSEQSVNRSFGSHLGQDDAFVFMISTRAGGVGPKSGYFR
ncbi:unnamed protein product [Victoria cruziana]